MDRERVLTLDGIAGFDWVRQQVVWKDVEGPNPGDYAWGDLDKIVDRRRHPVHRPHSRAEPRQATRPRA